MGTALAGLLLDPPGTLQDKQATQELEWTDRLEAILNSFYTELKKRHAKEREALEERSRKIAPTKWNLQEVYLDHDKCRHAREASRQHLARHRAWLEGPKRVGDVALHDLVAVQHYIDLDLEDLQLPEEERRNKDSFAMGGLVSEQMLLDAPRAVLIIDGERYAFLEFCERARHDGATPSSCRRARPPCTTSLALGAGAPAAASQEAVADGAGQLSPAGAAGEGDQVPEAVSHCAPDFVGASDACAAGPAASEADVPIVVGLPMAAATVCDDSSRADAACATDVRDLECTAGEAGAAGDARDADVGMKEAIAMAEDKFGMPDAAAALDSDAASPDSANGEVGEADSLEAMGFGAATPSGTADCVASAEGEKATGAAELDDDELRKAFLAEVTEALMRSLERYGDPPALLVRAVTSAMSQSGLASVERACYSSQVVVSGGTQSVTYALQAREGGAWDVTLSVHKRGFDRCIIWSEMTEEGSNLASAESASQGGPVTVPCADQSFVAKECGIRYYLPYGGDRVQADVFKLQKEMSLADPSGSLLTGLKVTEDESYMKGVVVSRGTDPMPVQEVGGMRASWEEIGAGTYRLQKSAKKQGGRKYLYSAPFQGTLEEAQCVAEQVGGAFFVKYSKWLQVVGGDSYDAGLARDKSAVMYQRNPPPANRVCPLETDDASRAEAHVAAIEAVESVAFAAAVEEWRKDRASSQAVGSSAIPARGGVTSCWSRGTAIS